MPADSSEQGRCPGWQVSRAQEGGRNPRGHSHSHLPRLEKTLNNMFLRHSCSGLDPGQATTLSRQIWAHLFRARHMRRGTCVLTRAPGAVWDPPSFSHSLCRLFFTTAM